MVRPHFGLTGLAVMGQNLARNVARNGFPIAVHNRTAEKTDEFIREHWHEGDFQAAHEIDAFVGLMEPPRAIMIMVNVIMAMFMKPATNSTNILMAITITTTV